MLKQDTHFEWRNTLWIWVKSKRKSWTFHPTLIVQITLRHKKHNILFHNEVSLAQNPNWISLFEKSNRSYFLDYVPSILSNKKSRVTGHIKMGQGLQFCLLMLSVYDEGNHFPIALPSTQAELTLTEAHKTIAFSTQSPWANLHVSPAFTKALLFSEIIFPLLTEL